MRTARDNDLILDLESLTVNGHRYAVRTNRQRVDSGNNGYNDNNLIGQIVGAINGDHGRYSACSLARSSGSGWTSRSTLTSRTSA